MLLKYSWLMFQMLMNVLLEEFPALDLGSVSTLLGVISASAIKASTSCTLAANTSVTVRNPSLCFSLFLPLAWKGLLIVLKTEMPGAGEVTGTKQTRVQFNPQYFGIHRHFISLVYLPVWHRPSHCRKLFLKLSLYFHVILFTSQINISFPYFIMQI